VDLGMAAKVRPAVVMSIPAADVDRALVTIVPHTTSARGSRFEAAISVPFLRAGVFDAQNLVTIAHAKPIRNLGTLQKIGAWRKSRPGGVGGRACYNVPMGIAV
jgi:mRNA interferase MazF